MKLRNVWRTAAAVTAAAALAACESESALDVDNLVQPDVERAFATAEGVEAILSNGFSQMLGATHGNAGSIQPAAASFSFESYGTVANFGMTLRATIPRTPIDNTPGNQTQAENFRDFSQLSLRGRTVAGFGLESPDYLRIGEDLAAAGLPTVFVFEGGYAVAEIGVNAVNVLEGFRQRAG